jgi:hypothetical protein
VAKTLRVWWVLDTVCMISGFRLEVDRSALFWVITQRVVLIPYRRFETTCRSRLHGSRNPRRKPVTLGTQWRRTIHRPHLFLCEPRTKRDGLSFFISWPWKIEPMGCSEKSVRNYPCTLRINPEGSRSLEDSSLQVHCLYCVRYCICVIFTSIRNVILVINNLIQPYNSDGRCRVGTLSNVPRVF